MRLRYNFLLAAALLLLAEGALPGRGVKKSVQESGLLDYRN